MKVEKIESSKRYIVIGPTKVGKTGLLSTLELAGDTQPRRFHPQNVVVYPRSDELVELFSTVKNTLRNGVLPMGATQGMQKYSFKLAVSWVESGFFTKVKRELETTFVMWDGPGGVMFPDSNAADVDHKQIEEFRKRVVAEMHDGDGLILCISADDPDAMTFFTQLPKLIYEVGYDRLPYDRVAICFTKADKWAQKETQGKCSALEHVWDTDPVAFLRKTLAQPTLARLRNSLQPETQVALGFVSAYGFLPDQSGLPNYNPTTDSMLVVQEEACDYKDVIDAWRPFQVLDPFVYVATGLVCRRGFTVIAAKDL